MTSPFPRRVGPERRRTRGAAAAFLILSLAAAAAAQESRLTLSTAAGVETFAAYGSEDEYVLAENDFPRTPAHAVWTAAAALTYAVSPALAVRLEGRRGFGTALRLTDPSDGDEVDVDSAARWLVSLDLLYRFAGRRLRPYVAAGAGLERVTAERRIATTRLGYAAVFEPPDDPSSVFLQAGAGIATAFDRHWGAWVEIRYVHAFGTPHDTNSGLLAAGLSYGF